MMRGSMSLLRPLLAAAAAGLAALLAGCVTAFPVQVNALADPALGPRSSYALLSGLQDVSSADLEFRSAAAQLHRALAAEGFYEAPSLAEAELAIFVSYGVGDPEIHQTYYSYPIYADVGGHASTITSVTTGPDGKPVTTTTTIREPLRREVIGVQRETSTTTVYRKFLTLSARINRDFQQADPATLDPLQPRAREAWRITAALRDSSDDLRASLPIMVAAIQPHLGSDTGKAIIVYVENTAEGPKAR
jgi:hypothetical protein